MSAIFIVIISVYLVLNIAAFVLMWIDRNRKKEHEERLPDNLLYAVAICGGSLGAVLGMYILDVRTHSKSFYLGLPSILLAHVIIALVALSFVH